MTSAAKWSPGDAGLVSSVVIKLAAGVVLTMGASILGRTVAWVERSTDRVGLQGVSEDDVIVVRAEFEEQADGSKIGRLEVVA